MRVAIRTMPLVLTAFVLGAVFAVPTYAQTGAIEGKVIDTEGKPLVGVTMSIDRKGITQHFEVKTDAKGAYFHAGLPTGQYMVTVMKDGQKLNFVDGVRVTFGGTAKVDFDFKAMMSQAPKISAEEQAKLDAEKAKAEATKGAFDAGRTALTAKNWDEAIRQFNTAAEADATQHVIFANLADAYSGARKYTEAADAYNKAIALKPDEAAYYNNLGIVYGNAGKIDEAAQALQKSAELNPTGAGQAYFNLGAVLTNRGRTKEASDAFKKAIEFKADMAEAYYQLGVSYMGSPQTMGDAVTALEDYIAKFPTAQNAEVAKQLVEAARAQAPAGYKSERAIADEKAKAEKERQDKEKAEQQKKKKR